jgi:GNAT superfamily N-acetyltransferase
MLATELARWYVGAGGFKGYVVLSDPSELMEDLLAPRRGHRLVELTSLYVHPLRRGRGWATELLSTATAWADTKGYDCCLWVHPFGPRATRAGVAVPCANGEALRQFYASHGFRRVPLPRGHSGWSIESDSVMLRKCRVY